MYSLIRGAVCRMSMFLCATVFLATNSSAEQLYYSDVVPLTTTNWSRTVTIPQFDPTLGTLISVQIDFTAGVVGQIRFENTDARPATIFEQLSAHVTLKKPDLSTILEVSPVQQFTTSVSAFDGVIDFAGTSGVTHSNITAEDYDSMGPYSADNSFFTGAGSIAFPVVATAQSYVSGAGNLVSGFNTDAYASVTVIYNYDAIPVCNASPEGVSFENLSCGESTTTIQLDGSGSMDDQYEDLNLLWATDCPNGIFSDPTAISPTLTFDSQTDDSPTVCSVTLNVYDSSQQTANCQVPVSVQACNFDCAGEMNGTAQLDNCGVCNGDNSCFDCHDTETSTTSFQLDGASIDLYRAVKKAVKLHQKITKKPKYGADLIAAANQFHITTWGLAWGLPTVITTCTNAELCQSVSNQAFEAQFTSSTESLKNLVTQALKGLKKKTTNKKYLANIKKLKKKSKALAQDAQVILSSLPEQSQCPE